MVEQRNNLRPGQLDPFLRNLGIEPSTVERQQRANIGWGASVRRRYGNDVAVSQEEVEDELAGSPSRSAKPKNVYSKSF